MAPKTNTPDPTPALMERLAAATQEIARQLNPKARVEVAVPTDGWVQAPGICLMCGIGNILLPVVVKRAYAGYYGSARTNKVTITVGSYGVGQTAYTKTCEKWTDERVTEAARILWTEFAREQWNHRLMRQANATARINEKIAEKLNADQPVACLLERAERAMQHHASRQVLRACLQAARVVGEIEERNRMLALIG